MEDINVSVYCMSIPCFSTHILIRHRDIDFSNYYKQMCIILPVFFACNKMSSIKNLNIYFTK